MITISTIHGLNGVVYLGIATAVPITERTEWHLSIDYDLAEDTVMADTWATQLRGVSRWSGSFAGFFDDASNELFTDATSTTRARLYIYPDGNTGRYYYGYCWPKLSIDATLGDVVAVSGDFTGNGALSKQ